MQAAQRFLSLVLAAGSAWMAAPAVGMDRYELLEQMKRMRPAGIKVLETRPAAGGTYTLGIYSITKDPTDPDLRRYKLWREYPDDLVVPTESVRCSKDAPTRVTRDKEAIYVWRLNPGGVITEANRENHLVWWAACVPAQTGVDPTTLTTEARKLGYSTLLVEAMELLKLPPR